VGIDRVGYDCDSPGMSATVDSFFHDYARRYTERDVEGVTDTREIGEHSVLATVHWNALDADGQVVRDTWTSYQLLATTNGWRFLSYTNHF
jgi:hypothetical protein